MVFNGFVPDQLDMNIPPNMDEIARNPFSTEFQNALQAIADTARRYQDIEEPLSRTVLLLPGDSPSGVFPAVLGTGVPIDSGESPVTRWKYPWTRVRPVLVENGLKWQSTGEGSGLSVCKYAINLYESADVDDMENEGSGASLTRLVMPSASAVGGLYDRIAAVMMTKVPYAPFADGESGPSPHDGEHGCVSGGPPASLAEPVQFYFYAVNPASCNELA